MATTSYNALTDRDLQLLKSQLEAELAGGNRMGMGREAEALRGYGTSVGAGMPGVPKRGADWTQHATRGLKMGLQAAAQGAAMERARKMDEAQMKVYGARAAGLDRMLNPQAAERNAQMFTSDFSGQDPQMQEQNAQMFQSDMSGQQPPVDPSLDLGAMANALRKPKYAGMTDDRGNPLDEEGYPG